MQTMASALGLAPRVIVPVPLLTPRLSSAWIHLLTPLSHRIARPLAEGLRNRVVVRDNSALDLVPQDLLTVREAIERAVGAAEAGVETSWRVTGLEPDRRLALRAEMKLPGEALLEFTLEPDAVHNTTRLTQTACFLPRGLFGLAYWYAVLPLHGIVFRGMLRGIRRASDGAT